MSKNLRTGNAGSLPRALVRRGAHSMKLGAFLSIAGVLAAALAGPASAQSTGGSQSLTSNLTNTADSEVLILVTSVSQISISPPRFQWRFDLSNPLFNPTNGRAQTHVIRSFTAAPFCDLTGAVVTIEPQGWTHEVFAASPQQDPTLETNKINWFVPVTPNTNTTPFQLGPGNSKIFAFVLDHGADASFHGRASALDTVGFSGETLGCPPPPVSGGGGAPPPGIQIRQHGPFFLAEAYPAIVQTFSPVAGEKGSTTQTQSQFPIPTQVSGVGGVGGVSGISPNNCFLNGSTQSPTPTADALPGILCLDKGITRLLSNPFATCNAALGESNPRVQAVTLNKIIPGSFKCDAFGMPRVDAATGAVSPAQTLFQDANHLRTWWTLRFTQPGTKFILDVVTVCDVLAANGARIGTSFHIDRWVWIVVADVRTFPLVVDLLHQDAIGTMEIPCILAEDVVSVIRSQFDTFRAAVNTNDRNGIFNGLIDLEAFIALNCFLTDVAVPEVLFPGPLGASGTTPKTSPVTGTTQAQFPTLGITPTTGQAQTQTPTQVGGAIGTTTPVQGQTGTFQPPGNQAKLATNGRTLGILDTTENPCCCKLLADLEFMGQQLGISFGPHTFVNGRPV
jgi:hypothetical protein